MAHQHPLNCTPRTIDEFPADLFTHYQLKHGAVLLHAIGAIYAICSIVTVCDRYFIKSLESICELLHVAPDVAGATFMAAGGSAPELFTTVIAVLIVDSDVGLGTIVGSGVFNMLFILSVSALSAGCVLDLSWWPAMRDSVAYILGIAILIIVIADQTVHWYEAMIMFLVYCGYILLMRYNRQLETWTRSVVSRIFYCRKRYYSGIRSFSLPSSSVPFKKLENEKDSLSDSEQQPLLSDAPPVFKRSGFEPIWAVPPSFFGRCLFVAMLPMKLVFFLTIPDCTAVGFWQKLYLLTFTMSVIWLGFLAYFLVWMTTVVGDTMGIPDTVMGLTILAGGTSLPDLMASVIVSRKGLGDMAVANCIGSNVFDLLLCLGLPWLLQTIIDGGGKPIKVRSSGMTLTSIILLASSIGLIVLLATNKWRLNKRFGVLCMLTYLAITVVSILNELNLIQPNVNMPPCPRIH